MIYWLPGLPASAIVSFKAPLTTDRTSSIHAPEYEALVVVYNVLV